MKLRKVILPAAMMLALAVSLWLAHPLQGAPFQEAKALYAQKCASCHALDGSGNTAKGKQLKLRDLRSAEVQGMSNAKLLEITAKGKGKMPGYEKPLGREKVEMLVKYVRSLTK